MTKLTDLLTCLKYSTLFALEQRVANHSLWPNLASCLFCMAYQMVFTFLYGWGKQNQRKWYFKTYDNYTKFTFLITANKVLQEHCHAYLCKYHPWLLLYNNGRAKQLQQRTYDLQSLIFITWPLQKKSANPWFRITQMFLKIHSITF